MCVYMCARAQASSAGRRAVLTDPASAGWQTGFWQSEDGPPLHGPNHEYSGSGGGTLCRHKHARTHERARARTHTHTSTVK